MRLIEAQKLINDIGLTVFSTNDIAATLNITTSYTSNILRRLTEVGFLVNLKRGQWGITNNIDPLTLPEYLTAPFPSYISLQSALYFHGIISQIPQIIYAVSLARTKQMKVGQSIVSIHHLQPSFFFEYTLESKHNIKMATPEKALIDFLYLKPAKSDLFQALPELELPEHFNPQLAFDLVNKIPAIRRRSMVKNLLEKILV